MEIAQLVQQSGRPIGDATMAALLDVSDAPTKLESGIKIDMQQPPNPEFAGCGGGTPSRTGEA